ncbi:hypothetical protein LINPERHAP1_LOCUS16931 [Linum perenne]
MALKETNMDPNETTHNKLLNQDPFHEVKRGKDRKKESIGYRDSIEPRRGSQNFSQGVQKFMDHNASRGGYIGHAAPSNNGLRREFRVVRDNRVNGCTKREAESDLAQSSSSNVKGSHENSSTVKASAERGPTESHDFRHNRTVRRGTLDEKRAVTPNAASGVQGGKHNICQNQSANVVGVYSSSSDPVHVPSPDSTPSAIKREVAVVGGPRKTSGILLKDASASSSSLSSSSLGKDSLLSETFKPFLANSKNDQVSQTNATGAVSRPFLGGQYYNRHHQQATGHLKGKASQHNKEWKPKSSQKSSVNAPGVLGTPKTSSSRVVDNSKDLEPDVVDLNKLSLANINEKQNVIIAQHIRVPEADRCRFTFGSFGVELDSSRTSTSGLSAIAEENIRESVASLTVSAPEVAGDDASFTKHDEISEENLRRSVSESPASGGASEQQSPNLSPSPPNLDSYTGIGFPSYEHFEPHQQHEYSELQDFSGYDPQTGYEMLYFRPSLDETERGHGLPSPQESLASHTVNSFLSSTIPMVQRQPPQIAQIYSQVHVPQFTNVMQYRQYVSPYYPQVAMPGYSSNLAYPHPSNDMQSAEYYNMMQGQPHTGYIASHASSFSAVAPQCSYMLLFPGTYT